MTFGFVGCAADPPVAPSPAQLAGARASTIVVAPLNVALSLPDELASSTEIVSATLLDHLRAHGKSAHLLEHRQGLQLWVESTREVSLSGATENFENAVRVLARRIGETIDFDALILPSLYLQNARLREDGLARWDGANQKIEFIGTARGEIEMPPLATISAVSLLLYVFDRNGNAIHSKRTGLELIQHMEIHSVPRKGQDEKSWILADDGEAIEDPDRLAAAIAHALYPFLPKSTR